VPKVLPALVLALLFVVSQGAHSQGASTIPSSPIAQPSQMILRDPTRPFTGKVEISGQLQLRSILIGSDRRLALINDTFVQIGDTIGSAKVIAIKEDSVVLVDSGRTQTLYLFTNDIRE
jgi:MSHA biogenesis protein MshK